MERKEVEDLIQRYLQGNCTEEERQMLYLWFDRQGAEEDWEWQAGEEAEVESRLRSRLGDLLEAPRAYGHRRPTFSLRILSRVAAAVLLLSLIGTGIWYFHGHPMRGGSNERQQLEPMMFEGLGGLVIRVDGRDYPIDSLPIGAECVVGQAVVERTDANSLRYVVRLGDTLLSHAIAKHILFVPKGKDFNVTLPDGSIVWLNTESALEYPPVFRGPERRVTMFGEAFFDVASNEAHPFTVATDETEVTATGTQFNVKAYRDESVRYATLVEGKITVSNGLESRLLEPNQQATSHEKAGSIAVQTVNVANVIAKRNGYFAFYKQDIASIMKEVSRWYDIEVSFQGTVSTRLFGGMFSRDRTLDELLEYFQSIGGFTFKQEGRRIIVMS